MNKSTYWKKKVKIIELVIVKENGTKPSKLEKKIIKKIKYIYEKK